MPQLETALTERLGVTAPLVQAPIGSASCPELAAAVASVGGLGMLAITWRDEASTRAAIAETRRRTDGVFGVNIVVDPEAKAIPTETHVEICQETGVEVVSFSFGDAEPYIDEIHDYGGTVLQTVGSAEEATAAVKAGVDIVVAQGWEAGGHVQSEVATLPLVPRVVDAIPETPVVAAGGIADGRGIAAALTLGAAGAWREWQAAGRPETDRPGAGEVVARAADGSSIRRYEDSLAVPETEGAVEALPLYAGQSVGLTEAVLPAEELVSTLVDETLDALDSVVEEQ